MPTPKTPLPELIEKNQMNGGFYTYSIEAMTINQIITYLKEREEAAKPLEGLQELGRVPEEAQLEKTGLKETLITELYDLVYSYNSLGYEVVVRTDVEDIINQVFRDNAN